MIAVRLPPAIASRTSGQVRSSIQTVDTWPYAGSATRSSATSKNNRFMNASWVPSVYEVALHWAKQLPPLSSGDLNLALPARGRARQELPLDRWGAARIRERSK